METLRASRKLPHSRFPNPDCLQQKKKEDRYQALRQAGLLTTIPPMLVAAPLIGFFIGRFLDRRFGTDAVMSIIFLIFGFIAAGVQIAKIVKIANRENEREK